MSKSFFAGIKPSSASEFISVKRMHLSKMFINYALFGLLLSLSVGALARTASFSEQNSINDSSRGTDSNSYLNDFRYMYKVYQECATQDLTSCLKLKLLAAMDRAARSYSLTLFDGITFVKNQAAAAQEEAPKSEAEIEASLPRSLNEKDEALSELIFNKVGSFMESHTLQIKLPTSSDIARSFSDAEEEEGRGKKGGKKGGAMMLLPLILGGTLVPLALGALALLAGKALIISKLALVLAGIIGLKKLLSGHSGHHDSGHVEVVSGHHGSGWGRSYDKEEANRLAYHAYEPKQER